VKIDFRIYWEEVKKLVETKRVTGGFGSTGKENK